MKLLEAKTGLSNGRSLIVSMGVESSQNDNAKRFRPIAALRRPASALKNKVTTLFSRVKLLRGFRFMLATLVLLPCRPPTAMAAATLTIQEKIANEHKAYLVMRTPILDFSP